MAWSVVWILCLSVAFIQTFSNAQYGINYRVQDANMWNDPKWNKQWYLNRYYESTLGVLPVWKKNVTGRGVVVAVVDDGFNFSLDEIADNYEPMASYDIFLERQLQLMYNKHGSQTAGVIGAKANNGRCGVGIAFDAKIGGIRLFNYRDFNDTKEGKAFVYGLDIVDIYSSSWGPPDNGLEIRGLGPMAKRSLREGTEKGRNKYGAIYVFSSGNGGFWGDSCAFNGYVNSIYTIAVGYLTRRSTISRNSEPCAAVMAAAYGEDVVTCSDHAYDNCVENFGHSSAAAAMASGIIALALQAKGSLTWRDVQHLIIRSSEPEKVKLNNADSWIINGANLKVHSKIGFGLMNAERLVDYAKTWSSVPRQEICTMQLHGKTSFGPRKTLTFSNFPCNVEHIEHVTITLDLSYTRRGMLAMDLTSPRGTKSRMLYSRSLDTYTGAKKYDNLTISSLQFWGENSTGTWTVYLFNSNPYFYHATGTLNHMILTVYGTNKDPLANNQHVLKQKLSPCQLQRASSSVGHFQPRCKSNGQFEQIQCFRGQCWCANKDGKEVSGTRQAGLPDCSKPTVKPGTFDWCSAGVNVYSNTFVCCGRKKYPRKDPNCQRRRKCFLLCCKNRLRKTRSKRDKCCGGRTYSPAAKVCCNGQAIWKHSWASYSCYK